MKKLKSIICLMLCMAMILPVMAFAKYSETYTTKIEVLPQRTQVRAVDYTEKYDSKTDTSTYTATMYQIKIPSQGYMVLNTNNAQVAVTLFKKFDRNRELDRSVPVLDFYGYKRYYAVLPKGVYYLHADAKITMQWKFVPIEEQKNYCRSYATKLAANKTYLALYPYGREQSKWLKINLTQKRAITVKAKCVDGDMDSTTFTIFNKSGKRIVGSNGKMRVRTPVLEAGTYYIKVARDEDESDDDHYLNRLVGISWQ